MDFSFYLEFSFFLVLLIALLSFFSVFLGWVLKLWPKPGLLWKLPLVVILGLTFLLSKEVSGFILTLLVFSQLPGSKSPDKEWFYSLFMSGVLAFGVNFFYFLKIGEIWEVLNQAAVSFLDAFHIHQGYRFVDVYSIFRFFRNYYPGLFTGVSVFLVLRSRWAFKNPITCYYRYTKRFSHVLIFPMLLFVLGLALVSTLPETHSLHRYFLNFTILFSLPYLLYGGLTVFYGLRRLRKKNRLILILFSSLIVFSGPLFLFILILIIGIGVSDVWMNYNRRLRKHPL